MGLYQMLLETYGRNEPIMTNEISYNNYSRPWIYKELNKLCENEDIIRYDKGIYYIPVRTRLGNSLLNPRRIIEKKYITNGEDVYGYYSGMMLLNQLGLTTQMANVIEVYTNNENSRVREITVGKQKVLIRKARTKITKENVGVQRFLELMNTLTADTIDQERKDVIKGIIKRDAISREAITAYAPAFPDKALRTLVESEMIYYVAQQ